MAGPGELPPCELLRSWPPSWELTALLRGGPEAVLPAPGRFLHSAVEVRTKQHRGRHLVAVQPLKAGELLLADAPLVVDVDREALTKAACGRAFSYAQFRRTLLFFKGGEADEEARHCAVCSDGGPLPLTLVDSIVCHNSHQLERPPRDGGASEAEPEVGLWPLACLANHGLRPNLTRAFLGCQLCYRALRDVEAGEELVDNYLDPRLPWEERSTFLRRAHEIEDEGPDGLDADSACFGELETELAEVRPLLASGHAEEARARVLRATARCEAAGREDPAFTDIFWLLADIEGQLLGDPHFRLRSLRTALRCAGGREEFSTVSCCLTAEALATALTLEGPGDPTPLVREMEALARQHVARVFGPGEELFQLLNPGLCKKLSQRGFAPIKPARPLPRPASGAAGALEEMD